MVREKDGGVFGEEFVVEVRIPSEGEIAVNPRRLDFVGGGWVDSDAPNVVNLYWRVARQKHFTLYSLLSVLEHEVLHAVLVERLGLQVSMKLDQVHRSSSAWVDEARMIFVNEFRCNREWVLPPYFEEPTEDMLE